MPEDLQNERSQRLEALQEQLKNQLGGKETYNQQFDKPIRITVRGIKKTLRHARHTKGRKKN